MILMTLDHASYFLMKTHFYEGYDQLYLNHTWISFLTRSLSHLCAPGFFLLMGYGMYYKYKKDSHISAFILRGSFLMLLQFIINMIWGFSYIYIGVIFTLGLSMVITGLLMKVMVKYGQVAFLIVLLLSNLSRVNSPIFLPGFYHETYVLYTLIPWVSFTWFGIYLASHREKNIIYGLGLLSIFFLVRSMNAFGNYHAYQEGLISYFNLSKYPPTLVFASLTLGLNILLINFFKSYPQKYLIKLGRFPLLFYIMHLLVLRITSSFIQIYAYSHLYIGWLIITLIAYHLSNQVNKIKWLNKLL